MKIIKLIRLRNKLYPIYRRRNEFLISGKDLEELAEEKKWADEAEKLQIVYKTELRKQIVLFVLTVSVLLAALLVFIKKSTYARISVEATRVLAKLPPEGGLLFPERIKLDRLEIDNLKTIQFKDAKRALNQEESLEGFLGLNLSGRNSFFIEEFYINSPCTLNFSHSNEESDLISISLSKCEFDGKIIFNGRARKTLMSEEATKTIPSSVREILFSFSPGPEFESEIRIKPHAMSSVPIAYGNFSGIKFRDRVYIPAYMASNRYAWKSHILSGNMELYELSEKIIIEENQSLILENLEPDWSELRFDSNLQFYFSGYVNDIFLGPPGRERNISTSLLEYFYKNESLSIYGSFIMVLYGFGIGAIRVFLS